MQIADCLQFNVDQAVLGQLFEHVIEEADTGRYFGGAAAVEIDPAADLRFLGVAFDRSHPHDALLYRHWIATQSI